MMAYQLCKKLIARGKTDGLADKIDVYYANNRLTTDEYEDLIRLLGK